MPFRKFALAALLGMGVLASAGAFAQRDDILAPANVDVTRPWLDACLRAGGVPGVGTGADPWDASVAVRQYNCDWSVPRIGPMIGAQELKPLIDLCRATTAGLTADLTYFPAPPNPLLHVECITFFTADKLP